MIEITNQSFHYTPKNNGIEVLVTSYGQVEIGIILSSRGVELMLPHLEISIGWFNRKEHERLAAFFKPITPKEAREYADKLEMEGK